VACDAQICKVGLDERELGICQQLGGGLLAALQQCLIANRGNQCQSAGSSGVVQRQNEWTACGGDWLVAGLHSVIATGSGVMTTGSGKVIEGLCVERWRVR